MRHITSDKKAVPWIIAIALFMETLDITIINTAIPKMALSFMVNPLDLKLALTSYLISLALFIPISGWVADKWGTQKTFVFALIVFTTSSFACGMANSLPNLVFARILQGVGGAFMMPVGRLIILRTFSKSELIHAMNFVTMPALLGPLLGPLIGGFITTYYSWPWIFYVNLPVGIFGIIASLRYIKNFKIEAIRAFDKMGFILFGLSLAAVFFALESITEPQIPNHIAILVGSGSIIGFLLIYRHYQKTKKPVLNLKLFSIRTFFIAAVGNSWIRLGITSVPFLLPLLLQIGYGLSPLEAGLLTCFWTIGMISMKFMNKPILKKIGFKKSLLLTSILTGASIASYSLISDINKPLIIGLITLNGLITSLQFTGMNMLYYADVSQSEMSHATSILSTLQQLSMGFGITLSTLVVQFFVGWDNTLTLNDTVPLRLAFVVMGILSACSVLVFLKVRKRDGHNLLKPYEEHDIA